MKRGPRSTPPSRKRLTMPDLPLTELLYRAGVCLGLSVLASMCAAIVVMLARAAWLEVRG